MNGEAEGVKKEGWKEVGFVWLKENTQIYGIPFSEK